MTPSLGAPRPMDPHTTISTLHRLDCIRWYVKQHCPASYAWGVNYFWDYTNNLKKRSMLITAHTDSACMKDVYKIFECELQRSTEPDKIGFENCFHVASNLAMIAAYSGFKQRILVAEILRDVFSQVGPLLGKYDIPKSDIAGIEGMISQKVSLLSSVYGDDYNKAYTILGGLRYAATSFNFKCVAAYRREPRKIRRGSGGAV